MKKNLKKIGGMFLVSCLTISAVMADGSQTRAKDSNAALLQSMGEASEKALAEQVKEFRQEDAEQQDAKEAYSELTDLLEESATVDKNYAGAYIDDNNELVVNLTTSSEKIKDMVQENTESQEVQFKKQKYSYEELMDVYENIRASIEGTKYMDVVSSFGVDEINNKVTVKITDMSYAEGFRADICDAECIHFMKAPQNTTTKSYLKPGGYIGIPCGLSYSIGWRGWRTNSAGNHTVGLVTAAHGIELKDEAYTYNTHTFGIFVKRRFGGTLDASFAQNTSKTFDVSNTIKFSGSSLKPGYYVRSSDICVGQKVYKVGMTTHLTSGTILNPSCTVIAAEYEGGPKTTFTDYVQTSCKAAEGDSGGLLYMDFGGAYRIVGIAATTNGITSEFVKADNIINKMNIYPY